MTQYIDKDALIAEIESLLDKGRYHEEYDCAYRDGNNGALYALKGKLDTIEVKCMDLEKEIKEQSDKYYSQCEKKLQEMDDNDKDLSFLSLDNFAKYFFELGMQVSSKEQKGEEV